MISKLIKNALDELSIKNYFITRANEKEECIVYNYTSKPFRYADNDEKAIKYEVMINIYCKNNIENYKREVIKVMEKYGFIRKSVASTYVGEAGFFCSAINFTIVLN